MAIDINFNNRGGPLRGTGLHYANQANNAISSGLNDMQEALWTYKNSKAANAKADALNEINTADQAALNEMNVQTQTANPWLSGQDREAIGAQFTGRGETLQEQAYKDLMRSNAAEDRITDNNLAQANYALKAQNLDMDRAKFERDSVNVDLDNRLKAHRLDALDPKEKPGDAIVYGMDSGKIYNYGSKVEAQKAAHEEGIAQNLTIKDLKRVRGQVSASWDKANKLDVGQQKVADADKAFNETKVSNALASFNDNQAKLGINASLMNDKSAPVTVKYLKSIEKELTASHGMEGRFTSLQEAYVDLQKKTGVKNITVFEFEEYLQKGSSKDWNPFASAKEYTNTNERSEWVDEIKAAHDPAKRDKYYQGANKIKKAGAEDAYTARERQLDEMRQRKGAQFNRQVGN